MLPTTRPGVCLLCRMLFAPILSCIFQHLSDLLINKCLHNAEDLVNSTLASRDMPAAQGSSKLFELRRINDRRWR